MRGNYAEALEFYQRSLTLLEALGDKAGTVTTLMGIGIVHRLQGNYGPALELYRQSLTQFEALGDKAGIASALNNIGNVYRLQRNYGEALQFYQRSLTLAEALGDKVGFARTLNNIGEIHEAQGNFGEALEFYQKSRMLAEAIGDTDTAFHSYWDIGAVHKAQGHAPEAIAAYQKAIARVEEIRSHVGGGEEEPQRFFEDKVAPYLAMVALLLDQNRTAEALAYAERARGRAVLDVLQNGRVNITKAMTAPEQEQERKLNSDLVSLNTQIYRENRRPQPDRARLADLTARQRKARLEYEAFQTTLYAAHPELKAQRGEARPATLEESGALLPNTKSALLEFVVTDPHTFLFVLTRRVGGSRTPNLRVYPLSLKRKDLEERVADFHKRLAQRDASFGTAARSLYKLLLNPAQAQLNGKTTLVIVPDGPLWELPFQALQPAENRYLVEQCALSYAPSLTVLREMRKGGSRLNVEGSRVSASAANPRPNARTPERPNAHPPTPNAQRPALALLLAVGNPALGKQTAERIQLVHRDAKLSPLPDAEREVQALAQMYGRAQSKVYVGTAAREARVKAEAGTARVLHFATHGILDNSSPMYSNIVLSQEESASEDGLLEAWELMKLELHADLVVLSACETARGRVGAGEGVIGMTWALFVAGCPTTVASQWKVESWSTSELMVEFHRRLRTGIGKAEALRQAQLKLLRSREYRHPFYWAGFVMVGDGS